MCFYFYKSDHGNLIGGQGTRGNRTLVKAAGVGDAGIVPPKSFVPSSVTPLRRPLFHGAEVSFLNYGKR